MAVLQKKSKGWLVVAAAAAVIASAAAGEFIASVPKAEAAALNADKNHKKNGKKQDLPNIFGYSSVETALEEYVYRDDGAFSVKELNTTYTNPGYKVHLLNFTSQKWLTPEDSTMPYWWHILAVIVPDNVDKTLDSSLLFIGGRSNRIGSEVPGADDGKILWAGQLAVNTRSTAAVLYQVPCQPITYPSDPWGKKGRVEDSSIAFTWWKYINMGDSFATRNPEWILEFPMTKAGVKAIDVVQAFMPKFIGSDAQNINTVTVTGLSKRGWTTWLVGAMEIARHRSDPSKPNRVQSIIPIVLDAVNVHAFLHRQYTFYGAFTYSVQDYVDALLTSTFIDTDGMKEVFQIVDPWYFLDTLRAIPKLVISAGGDQFLMPDDHRFFAREMEGSRPIFSESRDQVVGSLPVEYERVAPSSSSSSSSSSSFLATSVENAKYYLVKNTDHSLDHVRSDVIVYMSGYLISLQKERQAHRAALSSSSSLDNNNVNAYAQKKEKTSVNAAAAEDAIAATKASVRPTINWTIDERTGRLFVTTSVAPLSVNLTYSDSAETEVTVSKTVEDGKPSAKKLRRDFRWWHGNDEERKMPWITEGLEHIIVTSPTSFSALPSPAPEGRWRVFTLEMTFAVPGGDARFPMLFTVPASVIPFTAPFPPCAGEACGREVC